MRLKNAAALSLAVMMLAACALPVLAATTVPTFPDVPTDHKYKEYIDFCVKNKFISGEGDGKFYPGKGMTRFEVSDVVCNYNHFRANHSFNDIPQMGHIGNASVLMWAHKFLEGFGNNTFQPNTPMAREQAAVMFTKVFDLKPQDEKLMPKIVYKDKDKISGWAKEPVETLSQYKIMVGDTDGEFRPKDAITKAELCRVIWDITKEEWKQEVEPSPSPSVEPSPSTEPSPSPQLTVIDAGDLANITDLSADEASGTDDAPDDLAVDADAPFAAALSWAGLTSDGKIETGSVGTVTLTAKAGYTFTGIDKADLSAIFKAGTPTVDITGNTGVTLVFTLTY